MNSEPLRRLLGLARRTADPTDDAGLLARFAANGDSDAFELLVWRHGGMVLGVARRILGDVHAAEDVFQATFLALARQAKSVRRDGSVGGWLHRVARRAAVRAKTSGERRTSTQCHLGNKTYQANSCRLPDPTDTASQRELCEVLDEELDRLPERFRRAVVLCYLEGRSTAEAANELGCPRGTVLSRLATARGKLRSRLSKRGVSPMILPVIGISPPVIDGGLITTTVRMAAANTAAPPVIELCDGVIRAMILSKLKIAAVVVMTFGVVGGGAGWLAMTPGGPGIAVAGPQANNSLKTDDPPAKPRGQNGDNEKSRENNLRLVTIERLRTNRDNALRILQVSEQAWMKERVDARIHLAESQQTFKWAEEAYTREKSRNDALLAAINKRYRELMNSAADAEMHPGKDNVGVLERIQKQLEKLRGESDEVAKKSDSNEAKWKDALTEFRQKIIASEEQLALSDRLAEYKRRDAKANFVAAQEELNQFANQNRGGATRPEPSERKSQNLEHKLDDVLHELTELRRELKK